MREIVGGRDPHDSFCHLSFNHSALSSPPPPPFMGHMVSHSRKKKTLAFDQEMSSVPPPPACCTEYLQHNCVSTQTGITLSLYYPGLSKISDEDVLLCRHDAVQ